MCYLTPVATQRLQAFPSTDSSVLSLMANLFTQRSLDRNEPPLSLDLFPQSSSRDWRLETAISSAAEHGVLKPSSDHDLHAGCDRLNVSLLRVRVIVLALAFLSRTMSSFILACHVHFFSTLFPHANLIAIMPFTALTTGFSIRPLGKRCCRTSFTVTIAPP